MALSIDVTIEGRLTSPFKNDIRNLANFYQSTFKDLENCGFYGVFLSKVENV